MKDNNEKRYIVLSVDGDDEYERDRFDTEQEAIDYAYHCHERDVKNREREAHYIVRDSSVDISAEWACYEIQ